MKQTKNLTLVLVLVIVILVGFIAYQNTYKTTPTLPPQNNEMPIVDEEVKWNIYTDSAAGFSMKYPETWNYRVISESALSEDTGNKAWFGKIFFNGPEGAIGIAYGDGFGGRSCGDEGGPLENGVLESFEANGEVFSLCNIPTALIGGPRAASDPDLEYAYTWSGCGDCKLLQNTIGGQMTTYLFNIKSHESDLQGSPMSQMISSFKFE